MSESKIIDLEKARKSKSSKTRKGKDKVAKSTKKQTLSPKRKAEKRKRMMLLALLFLLVFGYSTYKIIGLLIERNSLKKENQQLTEQKKQLEEDIKHIDSLEYIEKKAREELNLVLPGEIIYVPEQENKEEETQN